MSTNKITINKCQCSIMEFLRSTTKRWWIFGPKKWGTGYLVLWECFQTKPCRADDLGLMKFTEFFCGIIFRHGKLEIGLGKKTHVLDVHQALCVKSFKIQNTHHIIPTYKPTMWVWNLPLKCHELLGMATAVCMCVYESGSWYIIYNIVKLKTIRDIGIEYYRIMCNYI